MSDPPPQASVSPDSQNAQKAHLHFQIKTILMNLNAMLTSVDTWKCMSLTSAVFPFLQAARIPVSIFSNYFHNIFCRFSVSFLRFYSFLLLPPHFADFCLQTVGTLYDIESMCGPQVY